MGLHVWRSERADGLLRPLAQLLGQPPTDPFAREVVAVPTAGIERWLAQELSLRLGAVDGGTDGICANVDFPFPGVVVGGALAAAGGLPAEDDVWRPQRLTWALLDLLAAQPDAGWWGPAGAHLASPEDGRRYAAARRIADLFDRYAVHRPEMVRAWAANRSGGDDVGPDADRRIDAVHAWQPQLWRAVRDHLGVPSTAERLADATRALASGQVDLDLPDRLSVFGLTALPSSYLEVLRAVADTREVHLFLLHPSPALWAQVEDHHARGGAVRGPRDDDETAQLPHHPLLRSWGRDAREMQTVFAALGAPAAPHQPVPGLDEHPTTLLARIQADVRADRRPPGAPVGDTGDQRPALDPADRSLQVHASHGRMRQVQVLRDAILHLLAADRTLEPRDVIVMCPDVEAFAPYVDAVFGAQVDADGSPTLRVRLADRSIRQTNPILKVVAELLDLADARLTGAEVVDLLGRGPVRRRFRFSDDDLERIETWVPELGIRWGLDAADRDRFDLGGVDVNTWRFGLQRLLTGVAIADEELRLVGDTVPYDDVEGADVELAGRLAECVDRLTAVLVALRQPRPLPAWRRVLVDAVDQLTATAATEAWQRQQLTRLLDDLVRDAVGDDGGGAAGGGEAAVGAGGEVAADAGQVVGATALTLPEVRVLLADRLRGRPSRASHRTGDLTVSTLVPMRAVPHRVVCLLGMDDGAFPRRTVPDGDDLVDLEPFVGDRDPRTEDRQLLLDALLSATDHLVVTYSGRDERTNEPLPPAVPIGELLDVVDGTVRRADGAVDSDGRLLPARTTVVVDHPLQPFDTRNYVDGALGADGPWSFDEVSLAGAAAKAGGVRTPVAFLTTPLADPDTTRTTLELHQLVRFLEHPTKAFLGDRLGVWFREGGDAAEDGIPLDLAGLPEWHIGSRLLTALRGGSTREAWERVERARGSLPPDPLATVTLDKLCPTVEAIVEAAEDLLGDAPLRTIEVDVPAGGQRRLVGAVGVRGDAIEHVSYSKLGAKHRIAAYARLVALTAHDPSVAWRAVLVCRNRNSKPVEFCTYGPLSDDTGTRADAAAAALGALLELFDRGMRAPAPLYTDTSYAIARGLQPGGKGPWRAAGEWETSWTFAKDDRDPCHVAVLGRIATFDELMADPPSPDELGPGWPECEQRIVAWARRLWDPTFAIEDGGTR